MGKLILFFLFLIISSAYAHAKNNPENNTSLSIKAKQSSHSFTSGPKTVLTREQLTTTGVSTLTEALRNLGNIQLQDMTSNHSQVLINLRGFGANASSNSLLLINGIPITNPDLAPPDLNIIPLDEIERIEILSGSESVLYGDQAVGGAINIITREYTNETTKAACATGSYHQRFCQAALSRTFLPFHFTLSASDEHSDNYRDHNQSDQKHLYHLSNYQYQTGRLALNIMLAKETMQYPGALTAKEVAINRRQASNRNDFFSHWNGNFHLSHLQHLTKQWNLETDIERRDMHGHGILFSPFEQSRVVHFFKPTLKGYQGQTFLMLGADMGKDDYILKSLLGTEKTKEQKYSLFLLGKRAINTHLTLNLGARAATQHTNSTTLSHVQSATATTMGVTYQISPACSVYLRRATSFRFPKADEMSSSSVLLNVQRGTSYEAGFALEQEQNEAKVEIYQLQLINEIAFDPTQTLVAPFGTNRNLDPTVRNGLSLSGKQAVTDTMELNGQYNFVRARFQNGAFSGNRIPLVSENLLRLGLNVNFLLYWHLYAEALFTGNQYSDNDDANRAGKLGGYTTYNFNLGYHYHKWTAAFHLNNIFNKYYYLYSVYQTTSQASFFYPAPGRNFTLTVEYAF